VTATGDPVEDLVQLALVYRTSALADPHLYSIMFTKAVPGFEPNDDAAELARNTLAPLEETVRAGIETGVLADVDPGVVAVSCWAFVHGLVSLELNGNLPSEFSVGDADETALRANANGWKQHVADFTRRRIDGRRRRRDRER
jgi:hypothetical protein